MPSDLPSPSVVFPIWISKSEIIERGGTEKEASTVQEQLITRH